MCQSDCCFASGPNSITVHKKTLSVGIIPVSVSVLTVNFVGYSCSRSVVNSPVLVGWQHFPWIRAGRVKTALTIKFD